MSQNNEFYLGAKVLAVITFTDTATDALTDPAVPRVSVVNPAGTLVVNKVVDADFTNTAVGTYQIAIDANLAGTWYVRGWATGNGQASTESSFQVIAPKSSEFGSEPAP